MDKGKMIRPIWVFVWVAALVGRLLLQVVSATSRATEKILFVITTEALKPVNDVMDKWVCQLGEAIE